MLVIGLTGPSGSGKTRVAEIFAAHGLPIINADEVYHGLLLPPSPCLDELVSRFGNEILNSNGTLNRPMLGKIVFSDPASLSALNAISHRHVMKRIRMELELLRKKGTPAAVLDAPQLFEAGADRDCGVVVSVIAEKNLRLERIMERDGVDIHAALKRMAAQKSEEFFKSHSDYVIENNGSEDRLYPHVRRILQETGVLTP